VRPIERVDQMLRVILQRGLRVAAFQSRVDAGPPARSSIPRRVTQLLVSFTFVRRLDDRLEDIVRPNGMADCIVKSATLDANVQAWAQVWSITPLTGNVRPHPDRHFDFF
jgi:hypothetical protein